MNVFITPTLGVVPALLTTLRALDFRFVVLDSRPRNPIKAKWALALDLLRDSFALLGRLRTLRRSDYVVVNSYAALTVLLLARLGLIRYRRLAWFAFLLHAPRYFGLFRWLFSWLLTERDTLLVFSRHELALYGRVLGLRPENLHYVPLVYEPDNALLRAAQPVTGLPPHYYFAGGYSSRDYGALIDVFRHRTETLVIGCSRLNENVVTANLPANVRVLPDLPRAQFAGLVAGATACLLPIQDDTGAAGQLFALEAMAYGRAVVATRTNVLAELIDARTGFLLTDLRAELPALLDRIDAGVVDTDALGRAGHRKLLRAYSAAAFDEQLRALWAAVPNPVQP